MKHYCGFHGYLPRIAFTLDGNVCREYLAQRNSNYSQKEASAEFQSVLSSASTNEDMISSWNKLLESREITTGGFDINRIVELEIEPDHAFALIARPLLGFKEPQPATISYMSTSASVIRARALTELETLVSELITLTQTVYPKDQNLAATGPRISQVVISACILLENLFKSVLTKNGLQEDRYTTCHFIKLLDPMKLLDYSVAYPRFPWMQNSAPFKDWTSATPTQSLPRYDRYNSAKHNAFREAKQPTLQDAFDAIAANYCLLTAMFGLLPQDKDISQIQKTIEIVEKPSWVEAESCLCTHRYGSQLIWKKQKLFA